jgi:hypothetical protein
MSWLETASALRRRLLHLFQDATHVNTVQCDLPGCLRQQAHCFLQPPAVEVVPPLWAVSVFVPDRKLRHQGMGLLVMVPEITGTSCSAWRMAALIFASASRMAFSAFVGWVQ